MAPDLNLLISLDALLEEGSVVGAARRMNLAARDEPHARAHPRNGRRPDLRAGRPQDGADAARARTARRRPRSRGARVAVARPSAEIDLGTLDKQFNVRANDIFVGLHSSRLLEEMARGMPRAMLRFMPEEDDIDDDALRSGRIDLFISASRRLGRRFASSRCSRRPSSASRATITRSSTTTSRPSASRAGRTSACRGAASRRADRRRARARGLARQVLLVVPTPYAAIFALQASDLILPLPEHLARGAVRAELGVRAFELPVPLETVLITQAWHPRFQSDPRTSGCDVSCAGCAPASRRCIRRTHDASYALVECKDVTVPMHRSTVDWLRPFSWSKRSA